MAQTIYLNMIPTGVTPRVYLSQYDVGETVNFVLTYGAIEYTVPTGATVKVQGTKPSGFGYTENATFTGNVASITVTADMTGEAGNVASELVVTKDGSILGSKNFIVEVEKTPHANGIIDGNAEEVMPELTQLVERVEDAASSVLDRQTVTNTLPAGSQATYSYNEDTNTQTFGIPQGEAGAGATGVVASAYSASSTYAVGDYVIHNSNLYRCTTAITTAESFTAAHWTQVVLGDDVSDVKSAISVQNYADYGISSATSAVPYPKLERGRMYISNSGWSFGNDVKYARFPQGSVIYLFEGDVISNSAPTTVTYQIGWKDNNDVFHATDWQTGNYTVTQNGRYVISLKFVNIAELSADVHEVKTLTLTRGNGFISYLKKVDDDTAFVTEGAELVDKFAYSRIQNLETARRRIVPTFETGYINGDGEDSTNNSWIRTNAFDDKEGLTVEIPNGVTCYINYYNIENETLTFKKRKQITDAQVFKPDFWYDKLRLTCAKTSSPNITLAYSKQIIVTEPLEIYSELNFTDDMQSVLLDVAHPSALEEEYDASREAFENCYASGRVGYIFASDFHVNYDTTADGILFQKNQLKIACDLANSDDVDFIVAGGDYTLGNNDITKAKNNEYMRIISDALKTSRKPVVMLRGNHDNFANSGQTGTDAVSDEEFYAMTQAIYRREEYHYNENDSDGLYFYFDIPIKKVRVIAYDYMDNHGTEQLRWLVEEALTKADAGWGYIFLCHVSLTDRYNPNGQDWVAEYGTIIDNIFKTLATKSTYTFNVDGYYHRCDYTAYQSNLLSVSYGHTHAGYMEYNSQIDAFVTVTGAASSNTSGSLKNLTPDDNASGERRYMSIYDPDKYLFDMFSVSANSMTRVRFGTGDDKTVNKPT